MEVTLEGEKVVQAFNFTDVPNIIFHTKNYISGTPGNTTLTFSEIHMDHRVSPRKEYFVPLRNWA